MVDAEIAGNINMKAVQQMYKTTQDSEVYGIVGKELTATLREDRCSEPPYHQK